MRINLGQVEDKILFLIALSGAASVSAQVLGAVDWFATVIMASL